MQKQLYEKYSARYFGVCKRYLKNVELAEDVLVKGFLKIFDHIDSYEGKGNFEGWMQRIFVNECLMELRKKQDFTIYLETSNIQPQKEASALENLYEQDILKLLDFLPTGCRTVFNLYVIEGYKHNEIAEQLGISEGTSKSQLNLAKEKLKVLLNEYGINQSQSS
ncbi:RNA polymerase sigma factor [Moheibacter stercoris]|uniref:RNA polymerase sigma-70 factor (ECF subfamily) n=1 Tax=Moheibacter stercoris TaxID=1628251 RepID=A0ABV2LS77_9FLAO